jgi:hypothetical protein
LIQMLREENGLQLTHKRFDRLDFTSSVASG